MIQDRTALYQGFLIDIFPSGMNAYRNEQFLMSDTPSYKVGKDTDITFEIGDDYGNFTPDEFDRVAGSTQYLGESDVCVGCGQQFPVGMLMYEGVEPIVFSPRCSICMIKQVQDVAGPENVILPPEWRN